MDESLSVSGVSCSAETRSAETRSGNFSTYSSMIAFAANLLSGVAKKKSDDIINM